MTRDCFSRGPTTAARQRLLEVAQRRRPPDLAVHGGVVANVYSGEWLEANVEAIDGWIAYVGPREPDPGPETRLLDATGRIVVPGYVEPHCHAWILYNPVSLLELALPRGTTTLVTDNLPFFLQLGVDGFRRVLDRLSRVPAHLLWVARVASQSEFPGERELFTAEAIERQLDWPEIAATAEVTRWLRLYDGEEGLLEALAAAKFRGKPADGHTAGASYDRLVSLVDAGLSADHEAITGDEALERLRLGLWTMLRSSSLRPDLPTLLETIVARKVDTRRLMLTGDSSGPCHYAEHGMVDGLLATAVAAGVEPMTALQMCTINPATFLGLDEELGGIAPGRRATLLVLPARDRFRPETVVVSGNVVARDGLLRVELPSPDWDALGCRPRFAEPDAYADPRLYVLPGESGSRVVPVMAYQSAVISRREDRTFPAVEGAVDISAAADCCHAALLDRGLGWVSRGVVAGLFPRLDGLASSYNTACQLLAVGRNPASMGVAAAEVARLGGGVALAEGGRIAWSAPLPVLGTATPGSFGEAVAIERELLARVQGSGYPYDGIVHTLFFLVCDFLPDLRLTPRGLLEVKTGRVLEPATALGERPPPQAARLV